MRPAVSIHKTFGVIKYYFSLNFIYNCDSSLKWYVDWSPATVLCGTQTGHAHITQEPVRNAESQHLTQTY